MVSLEKWPIFGTHSNQGSGERQLPVSGNSLDHIAIRAGPGALHKGVSSYDDKWGKFWAIPKIPHKKGVKTLYS